MKVKRVHCFFEQSGTFKNEFKKLGIPAEDYDILNEFGETENVVDLFEQIKRGYDGKPSVFDKISPDDLIFAFFPCTRFEAQILLTFWQEGAQHKKLPLITKLERDLVLQDELTENYKVITKLAILCLQKGLRLIIENPYNNQHYLVTHWCIKPKIIDTDRRRDGDMYKKPTQYFFINCEPENNLVFEPIDFVENCTVTEKNQRDRSKIQPQYANRFIRKYIIGGET